MKSYWWKAGLFLLAASGYCMAQSDAPSLGDIARQNRGEKKAKLVLSDQDQRFSRASGSSQSSSSANQTSTTSSNSTPASGTSLKTDAGKSATATSKDPSSADSAKQKLDFYKSEQDAWKTIEKRDQEALANEKVPFRRQMYQDALEGDRKTITAVEDKISELQSQVANKAKTATTSGGK